MDAVAFALNVELSPDDTHSCCFGCSSNPKLHGFFAGRVDNELFVAVVIMSLGEDALDIGAVIKLCEAEAAYFFEAKSSNESLSMLFSS